MSIFESYIMNSSVPEQANGLRFTSQNFSHQSFASYTFSDCLFEECDFTESSFEQAALWGCTFKNCTLNLVNLAGCRMENVVFSSSNLIGLNFSRCDTTLLFSMHAERSFLQYCTFIELAMDATRFKESKLIECRFQNVLLKQADFTLTDLSGTVFEQCDLQRANFAQAINYAIHPCNNKIAQATFTWPECIGLVRRLNVNIIE